MCFSRNKNEEVIDVLLKGLLLKSLLTNNCFMLIIAGIGIRK